MPVSVGTGATKSQIVRTPLRVFCDCVGKPDRIFFALKLPIDFTVKNLKYKVTNEIFHLRILALPKWAILGRKLSSRVFPHNHKTLGAGYEQFAIW